ncbi:MAG: ornithine carbamoyltransferase [Candidatus Portnoybacteria bacterium]|nr:ornithine carbamoyltransferase [Candidatus Portnoybacteria bacterium]
MKHLISLKEQTKDDIIQILETARKLKTLRKEGKFSNTLAYQTLIMLFQKGSTRTRLSFEAAMTELGGHAIFLESRTSQFSLTDFGDEIRAVMRFGDILMFRALKAADVEKAASYNQIPVIDACSEKYHPAQSLGDMLTMIEHSDGLENIKKVTWLGIENNVSNTLMLVCAKLGIPFHIAAPEADPISIDEELNKMAKQTGIVKRTSDLKEAIENADYVHTDTWMNMEFFEGGKVKPEFAEKFERRKRVFAPYQLNAKIIDTYAPQAKIMHCMPCHIGYEITRDAIDHRNSVIFDQAENRLHIQKAILLWLLDKYNL